MGKLNNSAGVVIYPTDTVWGIGADIKDDSAQRDVRKIKENDLKKPLSILFHDYHILKEYVEIDNSVDWRHVFSLETTILFPHRLFKKKISCSIYGESEYVGVRLLEIPIIKNFLKSKNIDAITTTSLNLKGEKPIVSYHEALAFKDKFCPDATLIGSNDCALSTFPSSIMIYQSAKEISIVRRGRFEQQIIKLLS